ncbi:SusD family protein [compost metagenome]
MRVAEMYLIEAEAKARLGNADAAAVLFEFEKTRNPSYTLSTNSGQALVDEILLQRRIELWGEGFRFYDLKRTNSALDRTNSNHDSGITNGVMNVAPSDKRWQWLIPKAEIDANPLIIQNEM